MGFDLLAKPRPIDLRSKTVLVDYFILTSIIGVGLFISIFAFIGAIHYRHEEALTQFRLSAAQVHTLVASNAASNQLQMEILSQYIAENRSVSSSRQLHWLRLRVQETQFSCVAVLRVDTNTGLMWQKKVLKGNPGCMHLTPIEPVIEASQIEDGQELSITRIIRLDSRGETFLALRIPKEALLPKESLVSKGISIDIGTKIWTSNESEFFLGRELTIFGQRLQIGYRPSSPDQDVTLGWAWMVLFVGSLITLLVGAIVFSLINRNIAVQSEVEAKTLDLREATERAIYANQTKSRFLANVSHEVRTPLNLILGMAEVLSETQTTPEQRNYIETFGRAGRHLLELVNDVLDVASIEAGEVPYEEKDMSLVELMENVSDFVSVACRVKKLSYNYEIENDVPGTVRGDSKRLRQVLINLVNNSIKFTERGGIVLRLSVKGQDAERQIVFEVTDSGIGIPQTEIDKIFGEFYQVNSSSTRARAGVGLGLSIVKTYVEHLRGSIVVTSELGAGSSFRVSLPLKSVGERSWVSNLPKMPPGERVLIVGPNTVQSAFIRNCLVGLGCEVTVMESGRAAVEHLQRSKRTFDHLIVDLVGRDMGGLDVLRAAELDAMTIARTTVLCPIVHRARDPEFLAELGVKNLCYAPVKMAQLVGLLSTSPILAAPTPTTKLALAGQIPEGMRVLVAEDDEDNRFLVQTYLSSYDIDLNFANDGVAALERYKSLAPDVDLLITDIQMPRMDGFDLIREIRSYEKEKGFPAVPIVALTADAQMEQMERVKSLGGNDYLTKPIAKAQLVGLLARVA